MTRLYERPARCEMPATEIGRFLDRAAERIDARREAIVAMAHAETALPISPRLADVELPRTTNQLRQAAAAAREGSWAMATIDTKANIRSCLLPLGPGLRVRSEQLSALPSTAFRGGDFAAAMAAGNPVIAKANTSHPARRGCLPKRPSKRSDETGLPPGTVQLIYRISHADGERLVADRRLGRHRLHR